MTKPPFLDPELPEVRIIGLKFHWDQSHPGNSSIPLVPNTDGWTAGYRSQVAYSIASTQEALENGQLKIQARFWHSGGKGRLQIRARDIPLDPLDLFSKEIIKMHPGQNALGNVAPTTIFFNETHFSIHRGKRSYVPMKLEGCQFSALGAGIYDINWKWEFRRLDEAATEEQGKSVWEEDWHPVRTQDHQLPLKITQDFELTKHRAYITLDEPRAPWTCRELPDLTGKLPIAFPLWSSALQIACAWAAGAKNTQDAARMITDRLHASGRFAYHPSPSYVSLGEPSAATYRGHGLEGQAEGYIAYFNLSKALERIEGGHGLGENANCFDCALIVASLTNALGCHLRVGKLQNQADIDASDADHYMDNRFEINAIRAMGKDAGKASAEGLESDGRLYFAYHSLAWEVPGIDAAQPEDFASGDALVYDACVRFLVDGEEKSAAGLPLGDGSRPGSYISLLAKDSEEGRPRCKPQPITVAEVQITG